MESLEWRLLLLLQERKTGLLVLGDFVTGRQRIESALTRSAGEVIESHFLAATQLLEAMVEEVSFAGLFAVNAEGHVRDGLGYGLGDCKV